MAKRSTNQLSSEPDGIDVSDELAEIIERVKDEPQDEPRRTVRFVLMTDVILKYVGPITGIEYVFNHAGAMVDIDELDAYYILEKMEEHTSCCGGSNSPSKYLEVVR